MRMPDGSLVGKDTGKYIVIWKRNSAGDWRWYRDFWNSSLPEAGVK
jgi:ketosteroid isomerase-like protein